jgi:hypothetical protein
MPAFDLKAELVETGTWKAFAPSEPLGPRSAPAQPKMDLPVGQGAPENDRWDIPIQERMKMQNAGGAPVAFAPVAQPPAYAPPSMPAQQAAPQPAPQAAPGAGWDYPGQQQPGQQQPGQQQQSQPNGAPEGGHTKSGWDFPVYESDDVLTGPGWGAPPKPAAPESSNSGMDQLGAAIGDVARGQQPPQQPMQQPMQQQLHRKLLTRGTYQSKNVSNCNNSSLHNKRNSNQQPLHGDNLLPQAMETRGERLQTHHGAPRQRLNQQLPSLSHRHRCQRRLPMDARNCSLRLTITQSTSYSAITWE